MAEAESEKLSARLIKQRSWWTDLKKKLNEVLPIIDTLIRLKEAAEAEPENVSPYTAPEAIEIEGDEIEDLLIQDVEYAMNGKCPYVVNAGELSIVELGQKIVAFDDEECDFESLDAFKATLVDQKDDTSIEVRKPLSKWVKKYRKVKKLGEDVQINWPEWEDWFHKTQTAEVRHKRLTPKNITKRDKVIQECAEYVDSLDDGELKTRAQDMLKRFGQPFTREELGEYNFVVKKTVRLIQTKERDMLAEIKAAKKEEAEADG